MAVIPLRDHGMWDPSHVGLEKLAIAIQRRALLSPQNIPFVESQLSDAYAVSAASSPYAFTPHDKELCCFGESKAKSVHLTGLLYLDSEVENLTALKKISLYLFKHSRDPVKRSLGHFLLNDEVFSCLQTSGVRYSALIAVQNQRLVTPRLVFVNERDSSRLEALEQSLTYRVK